MSVRCQLIGLRECVLLQFYFVVYLATVATVHEQVYERRVTTMRAAGVTAEDRAMRGLSIFELPIELQSLVVGHMPLRTMARLVRTLGA